MAVDKGRFAPKDLIQSGKYYRFDMNTQTVAANSEAVMTEGYTSDNLFYLENNRIKSRYSGAVQIITHIPGAPDNNNGRLWAICRGTGEASFNDINLLSYGAFLTSTNVLIANVVAPSFSFRIELIEGFKIGSGGVGKGYIEITIL